jgi:hypothetical protein
MIIFDLDGTLANCEHRRHFVIRPKKPKCTCDPEIYGFYGNQHCQMYDYVDWYPNWQAFCEACVVDAPIVSVIEIFQSFSFENPYRLPCEIEIWSGRCESVRDKTEIWIKNWIQYCLHDERVKMRPIGSTEPDEVLKERWLDEAIAEGKMIDFVFDAHPASIAMWRRRGIFVFNCLQNDREF